jgi:hypothetical protein
MQGEPRGDGWSPIAAAVKIGRNDSVNGTWEALLVLEREMVIGIQGAGRQAGGGRRHSGLVTPLATLPA